MQMAVLSQELKTNQKLNELIFKVLYAVGYIEPRTIHESKTKCGYFQCKHSTQLAILSQKLHMNQELRYFFQ